MLVFIYFFLDHLMLFVCLCCPSRASRTSIGSACFIFFDHFTEFILQSHVNKYRAGGWIL